MDLGVIARGTPGFAGADLANLVNEAALLAARADKKWVEMIDFEDAKDKVFMGVGAEARWSCPTRRSGTPPTTRRAMPSSPPPETPIPVHKVTIIPRGRALGLTRQLPIEDKHSYSKEYLETMIAVLLGGRVAEEVVFGQLTTGAGERHRAGHRDRPADGLRVGHERASAAAPSAARKARSSSAATSPAGPTTPRTPRGRSTPR